MPSVASIALTTQRLVLRPYVNEDEDAVLAACQDPEIQRWTSVPSPYTPEHAAGFLADVCESAWLEGRAAIFAVTHAEILVASVGIHLDRGRDDQTAEVGFWGVREFRGQGFVTEAVRAAAAWAFDDLGIQRLEWYAEVGNDASRRIAEKAGFSSEGLRRTFLPARDGVRPDAWSAALLATDPR